MNASADSNGHHAAWLVFLTALAVHALIGWQYLGDPFLTAHVSDALSYHEWAIRLSQSGLAPEPVFHQAPLFPLLLGLVYALAGEAFAAHGVALVVQSLLTSAAIALLVPIGREALGSRSAGVAAALLALAHGPVVFHSMKLVPIPLALFSQALALWTLVRRSREGGSVRDAALSGVALGLAALVRSEMLLFVPIAAATWAVRSRGVGRPTRALLALTAGLLVTILPVTLHNLGRGDRVLIASSAGENLFIGNQRGGDGGHNPLHPAAGDLFSQRALASKLAEEARGQQLAPSQVSTYWRNRAIDEIAADPVAWLKLLGRKLGRLFDPGDPTDMYSIALERRLYLPALFLLLLPPWGLLALAAMGTFRLARDGASRAAPLLALLAIHVAVLMIFFVSTRLRLPFYFFLALPAGLAASRLWTGRRAAGGRRRLATALLALAALSIHGLWAARADVRDELRLASVLSMQGRLDESLTILEPRLHGESADAQCLDQAGFVHFKRGDPRTASGLYRRALAAGLPAWRVPQTRTRLALALERAGEFEQAAREFDRAVADPAASAGTYFERGLFRLRRGNRSGASADLRRAAALEPDWAEPRRVLRAAGID